MLQYSAKQSRTANVRYFGASTAFRSLREKKFRRVCPFDETTSLQEGGLLNPPKWYNSMRKYPPEVIWRKPGNLARPARFYMDRTRKLMYKNRERPRWLRTIKLSTEGQHADAFQTRMQTIDPDHEFAQCQAWFMTKYGLSEEAAFENAKFKLRDFMKQKERVWEVHARRKYGVRHNEKFADFMQASIQQHIDTETKRATKQIDPRTLKDMRLSLRQKHKVWSDVQNSLRGKLETKEGREELQSLLDVTDDDDAKEKLRKEWEKKVADKMIAQTLMQQKKFISLCNYINDNPDTQIVDPTMLLEHSEDPREAAHLDRVNLSLMDEIASSQGPFEDRDKAPLITKPTENEIYPRKKTTSPIDDQFDDEGFEIIDTGVGWEDLGDEEYGSTDHLLPKYTEFEVKTGDDFSELGNEEDTFAKLAPYRKQSSNVLDEDPFAKAEEIGLRTDISMQEREEILAQHERKRQHKRMDSDQYADV